MPPFFHSLYAFSNSWNNTVFYDIVAKKIKFFLCPIIVLNFVGKFGTIGV